jgi:hypothetical protein
MKRATGSTRGQNTEVEEESNASTSSARENQGACPAVEEVAREFANVLDKSSVAEIRKTQEST